MRPSGRKAMRQGRSNCATLLTLNGGDAVAGRVPALICANTGVAAMSNQGRSEEHTSELQSHSDLVCRLLLEKKKIKQWSEYCSKQRLLATRIEFGPLTLCR